MSTKGSLAARHGRVHAVRSLSCERCRVDEPSDNMPVSSKTRPPRSTCQHVQHGHGASASPLLHRGQEAMMNVGPVPRVKHHVGQPLQLQAECDGKVQPEL